jgi:hypothetical protein
MVMYHGKRFVVTLALSLFMLVAVYSNVHADPPQVIFEEDFESGWGTWWADYGVWEIGVPTAGPTAPHGGANCAGTVLDGNYPGYTDSRLIGPAVTLPAVTGDDEIRLCFWHWFSYVCDGSQCDYGYVQVSFQDPGTGEWSAWENVSEKIQDTTPVWSRTCVDLTAYASQKVKIAFWHTADRRSNASESTGWYIDDVEITGVTQPPLPDIKAKGKDWGVFVEPGESVEITVALDPAQMAGTVCDWWIGVFTPFGAYWLNPNLQWVQSPTPIRVGAFGLFQLSDTSVLDMGLPLGFYTFFLILDNNPNGTLDKLSWYDYVNVVCGADGDALTGLEDADAAFLERLEYLMD